MKNKKTFGGPGLIEAQDTAWVIHPEKRRYLLSPFALYRLDKEPFLLPATFDQPGAAEYLEKTVFPLLKKYGQFYLILRMHYIPRVLASGAITYASMAEIFAEKLQAAVYSGKNPAMDLSCLIPDGIALSIVSSIPADFLFIPIYKTRVDSLLSSADSDSRRKTLGRSL